MYHLYALLAYERMTAEMALAERRRLVKALRGGGKVRRSVGQGLVSLGLRVGGVADVAELKRAA
jgi:hypothetical protein